MKISVVVCTHNRHESLKETLQSLQEQSFPSSEYEIVVVDNRSTDQTKWLVDQCVRESSVLLRYVFESQIGLSCARNTGIRMSSGAVLAFIDDDALADRDWLSSIVDTYTRFPDAECVGGRVVLRWKHPRPGWWEDYMNGYLSAVDFGNGVTVLHYPRYPVGTNITYKRTVFEKLGYFNVALGRVGSKLLGGEENDLCLRIERAGGVIYYSPHALVHHLAHESRLKKMYLLKKAFSDGRVAVIVERANAVLPGLFGMKPMMREIRFALAYRSLRFNQLCGICFHAGYYFQQRLGQHCASAQARDAAAL